MFCGHEFAEVNERSEPMQAAYLRPSRHRMTCPNCKTLVAEDGSCGYCAYDAKNPSRVSIPKANDDSAETTASAENVEDKSAAAKFFFVSGLALQILIPVIGWRILLHYVNNAGYGGAFLLIFGLGGIAFFWVSITLLFIAASGAFKFEKESSKGIQIGASISISYIILNILLLL